MKKLLLVLIATFAIFYAQAQSNAATPLVQQFKILDNAYPNPNTWIITATAIDGKFPSNALIIDANCSKFFFKAAQSQDLEFDLVANKIAATTALYSSMGNITSAFGEYTPTTTVINITTPLIQLIVASRFETDAYGPLSFHIVYQ